MLLRKIPDERFLQTMACVKNLLKPLDLTSSEKVIKENGYLINAYNNENDNIINTLTDQYIKELINYIDQDINYNLCYYEAVISTIFENKKIKILLDGASVHTAELVEGGIILHEKFFEKVN